MGLRDGSSKRQLRLCSGGEHPRWFTVLALERVPRCVPLEEDEEGLHLPRELTSEKFEYRVRTMKDVKDWVEGSLQAVRQRQRQQEAGAAAPFLHPPEL